LRDGEPLEEFANWLRGHLRPAIGMNGERARFDLMLANGLLDELLCNGGVGSANQSSANDHPAKDVEHNQQRVPFRRTGTTLSRATPPQSGPENDRQNEGCAEARERPCARRRLSDELQMRRAGSGASGTALGRRSSVARETPSARHTSRVGYSSQSMRATSISLRRWPHDSRGPSPRAARLFWISPISSARATRRRNVRFWRSSSTMRRAVALASPLCPSRARIFAASRSPRSNCRRHVESYEE